MLSLCQFLFMIAAMFLLALFSLCFGLFPVFVLALVLAFLRFLFWPLLWPFSVFCFSLCFDLSPVFVLTFAFALVWALVLASAHTAALPAISHRYGSVNGADDRLCLFLIKPTAHLNKYNAVLNHFSCCCACRVQAVYQRNCRIEFVAFHI